MQTLVQRRQHVGEDIESQEEWDRIFELAVARAEPARRVLARYHGCGHASFFNAWCDVVTHVSMHGYDDDESEDEFEEEGEEEEEEEEEDLGWGSVWSVPVTVVWYSILFAAAILTLLILLPHVYQATPSCAVLAETLQPVLSAEGCGQVSAGVAAVVEQSREVVHLVINVLLPLPSQPGTEQYWDVRLRRKLREALAPASGCLFLKPSCTPPRAATAPAAPRVFCHRTTGPGAADSELGCGSWRPAPSVCLLPLRSNRAISQPDGKRSSQT